VNLVLRNKTMRLVRLPSLGEMVGPRGYGALTECECQNVNQRAHVFVAQGLTYQPKQSPRWPRGGSRPVKVHRPSPIDALADDPLQAPSGYWLPTGGDRRERLIAARLEREESSCLFCVCDWLAASLISSPRFLAHVPLSSTSS
jgi:hypothetical protein